MSSLFCHRGRNKWYTIAARGEQASAKGGIVFHDVSSARQFLEAFGTEDMPSLRSILSRELPVSTVHRMTDHEVLQQLSWRLHSGFLTLAPIRITKHKVGVSVAPEATTQSETEEDYQEAAAPSAPPAEAPAPAPVQETAPAEEEEVAQWITFKVVDDETDEPIEGVKLNVRLPDDTVKTFTTDAAGEIHIPDLDPGTCTIEQMVDDDALEVLQLA